MLPELPGCKPSALGYNMQPPVAPEILGARSRQDTDDPRGGPAFAGSSAQRNVIAVPACSTQMETGADDSVPPCGDDPVEDRAGYLKIPQLFHGQNIFSYGLR